MRGIDYIFGTRMSFNFVFSGSWNSLGGVRAKDEGISLRGKKSLRAPPTRQICGATTDVQLPIRAFFTVLFFHVDTPWALFSDEYSEVVLREKRFNYSFVTTSVTRLCFLLFL